MQVIILIGNKADLEAQRDVTYEEAKQFAEENGEWNRWTTRHRNPETPMTPRTTMKLSFELLVSLSLFGV